MIQRKANVIFYERKRDGTANPRQLATGEVLIRRINIATNEWRIMQFYHLEILVPRDENIWHFWNVQSEYRRVTLPDYYWEDIICCAENDLIIQSIPKTKESKRADKVLQKALKAAPDKPPVYKISPFDYIE